MASTDRTWVGFLRGMNVGGRRLTNDVLAAAVEACGCRDVRTHQASGNVVVTDARDEADLAAALEVGLEAELGYPVPVFLRTSEEVTALARARPFPEAALSASTGKPQVILLHAPLSAAVRAELDALVPPGDHLVADGRALHWLPAAGLSETTMDLRSLGERIGGTTVRTQGTLERLAARFL